MKYLVPQLTQEEMLAEENIEVNSVNKIFVAFPSTKSNPVKKLCHCHNQFVYKFLECPNCRANLCLQTDETGKTKNLDEC